MAVKQEIKTQIKWLSNYDGDDIQYYSRRNAKMYESSNGWKRSLKYLKPNYSPMQYWNFMKKYLTGGWHIGPQSRVGKGTYTVYYFVSRYSRAEIHVLINVGT